MDHPETLATMCTLQTKPKKNTSQKSKKLSSMDPTKKTRVDSCAHETLLCQN